MTAAYASLRDARDAIKEVDASVVADDVKLLNALRVVTLRIDEELKHGHTPFLPRIETRYFTPLNLASDGDCDASLRTLYLDRPLLEATTVLNGEGSAITAGQYQLVPRTGTPKWHIRLSELGVSWQAPASAYAEDSVSVTGVWGHHSDYSSAWLNVDTVQNAGGINSSTTSITVASASGADLLGRSPRLSPGMLLRIDSEWLALTAVSSNTLTVMRGQRGSTAAAHDLGAAIAVWQVEAPVQAAAARWAAYLVKRQGAFASSEADPSGMTITRYPKDMPDDVAAALARYRRDVRIWAV